MKKRKTLVALTLILFSTAAIEARIVRPQHRSKLFEECLKRQFKTLLPLAFNGTIRSAVLDEKHFRLHLLTTNYIKGPAGHVSEETLFSIDTRTGKTQSSKLLPEELAHNDAWSLVDKNSQGDLWMVDNSVQQALDKEGFPFEGNTTLHLIDGKDGKIKQSVPLKDLAKRRVYNAAIDHKNDVLYVSSPFYQGAGGIAGYELFKIDLKTGKTLGNLRTQLKIQKIYARPDGKPVVIIRMPFNAGLTVNEVDFSNGKLPQLGKPIGDIDYVFFRKNVKDSDDNEVSLYGYKKLALPRKHKRVQVNLKTGNVREVETVPHDRLMSFKVEGYSDIHLSKKEYWDPAEAGGFKYLGTDFFLQRIGDCEKAKTMVPDQGNIVPKANHKP